VAHRHLGDQHVGVELHAEFADRFFSPLAHLVAQKHTHAVAEDIVEDARAHGFAVEHDIFSRSEARKEAEFLMDHAEASIEGIEGARKMNLSPSDLDAALKPSGLHDDGHAEKNAHERGLPCPVFSHEA
jgi:hypothetical protein